jgi:hypothetical protein
MNLTTSMVAGAAVLAAGGLFATQAIAAPVTPMPAPASASATPATTVSSAAANDRSAGQAGVIWFFSALTAEQRGCLADANLQRPEGKLTAEQRTQLQTQVQAAITSCGIELSSRAAERQRLGFAWASLTSEQQHCLASTTLTRPTGRLTSSQRLAVRQAKLDAATACGVGVSQ